MSILNSANIKKTLNYMKRNGLGAALSAVRERLDIGRQPKYQWNPLPARELQNQKERYEAGFSPVLFSIVVPAYRTSETYLKEMLDSVLGQTYGRWELILADATEDDSVKRVTDTYEDSRIRYFRLTANDGIADNTNQGIAMAKGDYVGLLDHDDLLTENALYEMATRIEQEREKGVIPELLYSDEDKCNGDGSKFYDPNFKEKFNLDLLLSNNYICHFLVMKRELIQELRLRREYDGAQDYDLVLRAAGRLWLSGQEERIVHIPRVLYHWRCHNDSTAENPLSKRYAYDAGRRAVQDFSDQMGWGAEAADTKHLGFYSLQYGKDPILIRKELAAVGGKLVHAGKIVGGRMDAEGNCLYEGLPTAYSGYLHRAILQQDAEVLDIRNIEVRPQLRGLFADIVGVPYVPLHQTEIFDAATLPEGTDYREISIRLCRHLAEEKGMLLLYMPEREMKV